MNPKEAVKGIVRNPFITRGVIIAPLLFGPACARPPEPPPLIEPATPTFTGTPDLQATITALAKENESLKTALPTAIPTVAPGSSKEKPLEAGWKRLESSDYPFRFHAPSDTSSWPFTRSRIEGKDTIINTFVWGTTYYELYNGMEIYAVPKEGISLERRKEILKANPSMWEVVKSPVGRSYSNKKPPLTTSERKTKVNGQDAWIIEADWFFYEPEDVHTTAAIFIKDGFAHYIFFSTHGKMKGYQKPIFRKILDSVTVGGK